MACLEEIHLCRHGASILVSLLWVRLLVCRIFICLIRYFLSSPVNNNEVIIGLYKKIYVRRIFGLG